MTTRQRRRVESGLVLTVVVVLVVSSFSFGVAAAQDTVTLHDSVGGAEISVASDGETVYIKASDGMTSGGQKSASIDGGTISVTLFDDGTGDDDAADNGVYWGHFTITSGSTDAGTNTIAVADGDSVSVEVDLDGLLDPGTASLTADLSPPGISAAETTGSDSNGNVDQINVTFNQSIDDSASTLDTSTFSLSTGSVDSVSTGDTSDDDTVTLQVSGLSGTDATPDVTLVAGKVVDEAGGSTTSAESVTATDATAPIQLSTAYDDADGDGTVDFIRVNYSEDVSGSTLSDDEWSVTSGGDPNLSNPTNAQFNGATQIRLNVSADANVTGPQTASVSNPTVRYDGTSINDSAGNQAAAETSTYTDVADPVVKSAESVDTDGDGQIDAINVTFTELISQSQSTGNDASADNFTLSGDDAGSVTKGSLTIPGDGPTVSLAVTGPADDTNLTVELSYTANSLRRNGANIADQFSDRAVDDNASPVVSGFSLTADDANEELDVSFDVTESLSTISVSITGPESATLTSFSMSGSTYAASTSVSTNGDYTATLDTAEDPAGNSAGSSPSDTASVSFVSTSTSTPTPTPTATPESSGGGSGNSPPSELSGTSSKARISGTTGLSEIGVTFGSSAGGTIRATEVRSLGENAPPGTFVTAADITVPDTFTETASTVKFAISRDRLAELGVDASSLTVYRFHDGSWEPLETRIVDRGTATIVVEADTPGFSRFAVMAGGSSGSNAPTSTPTSTASGSDDGADGDSESSDGSPATTSSGASDGTDATSTQADEGDANSGTETSTRTPGFGVAVALAALLTIAALTSRRRD